jgi:mono/diheme cytochrome c family protein
VSKGPLVTFGIFAAVCVIAIPYLALAKEGGEDAVPVEVESWDQDGKALFANNCGACHTLAAAGTDGVVGPNLDDLLAPGGTGTYDGGYARAINAVTCGFGTPQRMPAGILQGDNAKEVAAFVGAYAGQLGDDAGPLEDTRSAEKPEPPSCETGAESGAESGTSSESGSGTESGTDTDAE